MKLFLTALVAISIASSFAFSQTTGGPKGVVQQGGDCSLNVNGNNNTSSLTCASLDRKVAAQIRDIVNGIKGNAGALRVLSDKLDIIKREMSAAGPIINQSSEGANSPNTAIVGNGNNVTVNPDRGWRKLTNQEITETATLLAPFAGQKVSIVVSNPEADRMALAQQFATIFRTAKWEFSGINTAMVFFNPAATEFPHGIVLHVGEVNPAVQSLGNILIGLFGRANIPDGFKDEKFAKDQIEINIWPRPN